MHGKYWVRLSDAEYWARYGGGKGKERDPDDGDAEYWERLQRYGGGKGKDYRDDNGNPKGNGPRGEAYDKGNAKGEGEAYDKGNAKGDDKINAKGIPSPPEAPAAVKTRWHACCTCTRPTKRRCPCDWGCDHWTCNACSFQHPGLTSIFCLHCFDQ